jgi:hypothetical protein
MAQAQAAALAAAAEVSTAVIAAGGSDAGTQPLPQPPPPSQQQQQCVLQDEDHMHTPVGITDTACLPSSLLLRDIHMGLMRLMDGSGPKAGKRGLKPPPSARFCPTDSQRQLQTLLSAPHWSHRAAQVVKQAGAVMTGPEPQVGWFLDHGLRQHCATCNQGQAI